MTSRRQWLLIATIVAALGTGLFIASVRLGAELFPLDVGSRAPDFVALTIPTAPDSVAIRKGIADYRGEVVLLNVWATWCAPCRIEMPSMQRLHDRLGAKGLRIVAVSIDDPGMEAKVRAFTEEFGLTFEVLYDAPGSIRSAYRTTGVPETFVIGRDGRIRRWISGADNWASASNVAFIERLLAEPRS